MVSLIIGDAGSGKTHKIMDEIASREDNDGIYVVEGKGGEYSSVFPGSVKIVEPEVDLPTLQGIENNTVIFDCDVSDDYIVETMSNLVRTNRIKGNNVIIATDLSSTFLDNPLCDSVLRNANCIEVGCLSDSKKDLLSQIFDLKIPDVDAYKFDKIVF